MQTLKHSKSLARRRFVTLRYHSTVMVKTPPCRLLFPSASSLSCTLLKATFESTALYAEKTETVDKGGFKTLITFCLIRFDPLLPPVLRPIIALIRKFRYAGIL